MLSKLTLIGLHNYTEGAIWDNLELPEGIDVESVINEILRQGGEFPLIYPDPEFLKLQIGMWSKKWKHNFDRWIKAYNFEYEALFNLDVKSTITEEGTNNETGLKTSSDNRTVSGNGTITTSGTTDNVHSKAAYDTDNYTHTEKDEISSSSSTGNTTSETSAGSGTENTKNDSTHKIVTEEYRRGNQGITMSQELLKAELDVWLWNIYEHIADIFVNEFCVCLYM